MALSALVADPQNRRKHTARNLGMIADALTDVGPARSIVLDESDLVLAGNGVLEAAAKVDGIHPNVLVVEPKPGQIVAVRRSGLSEEAKRRLAMYDNRAGELAEWNIDQLLVDRKEGLDLAPFFDPRELASLLSLSKGTEGKVDPDLTPAPRKTDVKVGDLFELGRHRLLCGDATSPEAVARLLAGAVPDLMSTDPPYGVKYDPSWRADAGVNRSKKKLGLVENDDRADWTEAYRLFPGAIAYVWHAGLFAATVQAGLEATGFEMRAQIIWAKDRMALSRGDYHWQHEPCWYAVRAGKVGERTRDRSQVTLWRIPRPTVWDDPNPESSTLWEVPSREDGGHGHGTQKPVECMARPMRNHKVLDVYDPFCGSGTSIIAAEMLGRRCYAMELSPVYVQVEIDRWEQFTGQKARKVA